MNLIKYISALYVALIVPVACAVTREELCGTLAGLESHLTNERRALSITNLSSECSCSEPDINDKSFTVDCTTEGSCILCSPPQSIEKNGTYAHCCISI